MDSMTKKLLERRSQGTIRSKGCCGSRVHPSHQGHEQGQERKDGAVKETQETCPAGGTFEDQEDTTAAMTLPVLGRCPIRRTVGDEILTCVQR